jgi:hypothetical protein
MKIFKTYGKLSIHEIGVVIDSEHGYMGTALLLKSPTHTSISANVRDFKFASKCFETVYFRNMENKIVVLPMEQVVELFKKARDHGEFRVIEWFEIEHPFTADFEIPFDE